MMKWKELLVESLQLKDNFLGRSSIIGPTTILTAAHCVVFNGVTEPAESFHAIANYRKSASEVRIDFASVTPHPNYTDSNGIQNDIAILITTEPIAFSDTVQPVCIAREDTRAMEYRNATAMGWGYTDRLRNEESLPDELQYVQQIILPNRLCSLGYFGVPVEGSKICGGTFNGICSGDSGGPLVHLSADKPPVEIGVASYISGLFGCGSIVPGVWTRVSFYNDFLVENSADELCTI